MSSLLVALLTLTFGTPGIESTCYGTVSHGRIENAVPLPSTGTNFTAYSELGPALGRTYVHSIVSEIVVSAYSELEKAALGKVFVYAETGWAEGGRIRPHRTHQNGTSVDFMVPVLNKAGSSVPLPTSLFNKFGYAIEFDEAGRFEDLVIDFEAIGAHLFQLKKEAEQRKVGITQVIFDPRYFEHLKKTTNGPALLEGLKFMQKDAWVRHDEHYHVDFAIQCRQFGA